MRIAILADIHGNPIALDAVLDDIAARGGVDGYWFIGDYAALGYDPSTCIERVRALPGALTIRGNTDRYTVTDDRPPPTPAEVIADPHNMPVFLDVAHSFAWTRGYVTARGQRGWLHTLPVEQRLTLPDGTRVLLVHAQPGRDDGPGISLATGDDELAAMLANSAADLVIVGHVHWPQDRTAGGVRLVNPGSVSNPPAADLRASYAVLDADADGTTLTWHRVALDIDAILAAIRAADHPAANFLLHFWRGELRPSWLDLIDTTPYTPMPV